MINKNHESAFSLAEILITLGVIGIVTILTLPTIIDNYKKSIIETSVKKFYTTMNQAIILSERENGDRHEWTRINKTLDNEPFWDKYFDKYVTTERMKTLDGKNTIFIFPDGSGVRFNASDVYFCIKAKYLNNYANYEKSAQCMIFGFYPNWTSPGGACVVSNYKDKGIEPYIQAYVNCNRINEIKYLCEEKKYYAKALQINNWKFSKDCKLQQSKRLY